MLQTMCDCTSEFDRSLLMYYENCSPKLYYPLETTHQVLL